MITTDRCLSLQWILSLVFLMGPKLNGLFCRQSGTSAGYLCSTTNKNRAIIWEESTMYEYLLNPKKASRGACPSSTYINGALKIGLNKIHWVIGGFEQASSAFKAKRVLLLVLDTTDLCRNPIFTEHIV
ncbi:hypothetical protein QJS10_CPB15g01947 [Acorus calamus]|uniref:Secreted protein n=1 Tax=Acorus calamus TaxID=4465 RepID=A0AAV9D499_ACOCL|nr:hypothetical protein QJS10_CPB15g01947 [Acorus calamus]